MKIACYTDIHIQQTMLNLPVTIRQSATKAAELTAEIWGKADLGIVGGDNISDYPEWNRSCALPYRNWLDMKQQLTATFAAAAKGGRVLYVDGNNDMILGDFPTAENPPYNTCDFYPAPMGDTLGMLTPADYIAKYAAAKGKQAGEHLLAFHYTVDGIDFFGLNIDPDTAFNSHDGVYAPEALAWLKQKINEADPEGNKLIFVVGHLSATVTMKGTDLREDMDEERRTALYDVFKGHRNLFYLYGHVHGQDHVHADSATGILHFDKEGRLLANPCKEDNRAVADKRDFSTVHMGGLRPFLVWNGSLPHGEYFQNDVVPGTVPGEEEGTSHAGTATPRLAQFLLIETGETSVTFRYRNTGDYPGYTTEDIPAPYTVTLLP